MDIALATSNPAKQQRLEWLLGDLPGVQLRRVPPLAVAEGEHSLCDNAADKARAYAARYTMRSVATDGGLLVPALGALWNPVLTGRRAGELLELMRGLTGAEREATQLECVVVADQHAGILGCFEARSSPRGVADDLPAPDLRAGGGFWLPGLLRYGPARRRLAELGPDERDLIDDHWLAVRDAVRAVIAAQVAAEVNPPGAPGHPARG